MTRNKIQKHYFSELPKCKGTLLEELLKKITDSMDCKLYCVDIILFICKDILGFITCIEILIMCQSRIILNDDSLFQLTFLPLIQGNFIRIFVFVIVIHNLFHQILSFLLIHNPSLFSSSSVPITLQCCATSCQRISWGL